MTWTPLTMRAAFGLLCFLSSVYRPSIMPPLTSNVCIAGPCCPNNFSTCLLPSQVVLRLLSHPYLICSVVQPMGLHHHCILNVCIEGPCPINFSACFCFYEWYSDHHLPGHIFFSFVLMHHATLAIQVCWAYETYKKSRRWNEMMNSLVIGLVYNFFLDIFASILYNV